MKTHFSKIFIFILLSAASGDLFAQRSEVKMIPSGRNAEKVISAESLQQQVEFLSDTVFRGRATGTRGAAEAAFWITRRFQNTRMVPFNGSWSRAFLADGTVGRNIMGLLPGQRNKPRQMYVVVCAHYDNHGVIEGNVYPGADSNASGVAALVSLAEMFSRMKELGRDYGRNLIFVASDAKERNSAGAQSLIGEIKDGRLKDPVSGETITPDKIYSTVVLDIIGSTLEPVHKGRNDYLIMLSGGQFTYDLARANEEPGLGLDISTDYYGSKGFTEMFYSRFGDQKVFVQNGLLCSVFTSGITMLTNKVTDTAETLDYETLRKRIFLIFHWLEKIL